MIDIDDPVFAENPDIMVWVLLNDDSVRIDEAAFQIGMRNMRAMMPYLINSVLNDKNELVRHKAIEALGLMPTYGIL